jgi:hypothetical protein
MAVEASPFLGPRNSCPCLQARGCQDTPFACSVLRSPIYLHHIFRTISLGLQQLCCCCFSLNLLSRQRTTNRTSRA